MFEIFEYILSFKLFDQRFILQLCTCFGSATFFTEFLSSIIEALIIFDTVDIEKECELHKLAKQSILW